MLINQVVLMFPETHPLHDYTGGSIGRVLITMAIILGIGITHG